MTVLNRRPGIASLTTIGVLALAVTLTQLLAPCWTQQAGLDVWNYPALVEDERETAERTQELLANYSRLQERVEAAEHIAELMIVRRLTLNEAITRILEINADRPHFVAILSSAYPDAAGERHLVAEYLLVKVSDRLTDDPARRDEVLNRLRNDLHNLDE